jgi:hypothetical protein
MDVHRMLVLGFVLVASFGCKVARMSVPPDLQAQPTVAIERKLFAPDRIGDQTVRTGLRKGRSSGVGAGPWQLDKNRKSYGFDFGSWSGQCSVSGQSQALGSAEGPGGQLELQRKGDLGCQLGPGGASNWTLTLQYGRAGNRPSFAGELQGPGHTVQVAGVWTLEGGVTSGNLVGYVVEQSGQPVGAIDLGNPGGRVWAPRTGDDVLDAAILATYAALLASDREVRNLVLGEDP